VEYSVDYRPIYRQIAGDLRSRIQAGELAVGDQIPTEGELCAAYGVSRMTVRQALAELTQNGFIVRRRGRGTYVSSDKAERSASRLLGFLEDAQAHDLRPGIEIVDQQWVAGAKEDSVLLGLNGSQRLYQVRRLRFANDEPIGINLILLAEEFEPYFRQADFRQSFYGLLQERIGVQVKLADQRVEAVACPDELAKLLRIPGGTALLKITRVTFLADGRLAGLTRTFYRGDRYYLSLKIDRADGAKGGDP
jgi:GntR family transcriptional regulator